MDIIYPSNMRLNNKPPPPKRCTRAPDKNIKLSYPKSSHPLAS